MNTNRLAAIMTMSANNQGATIQAICPGFVSMFASFRFDRTGNQASRDNITSCFDFSRH